MNILYRLCIFCLIPWIICSYASMAWSAPDPEAVVQRFSQLLLVDSTKAEVSYDHAMYTPNTDSILITNLEIKEKAGDRFAKFKVISLKGYDESNRDGLTAENISINDIQLYSDEVRISIGGINLSEVFIPTFNINRDAPETWNFSLPNASITRVIVQPRGKQGITIGTIVLGANYDSTGILDTFNLLVTNFKFPTDLLPPSAQSFMKTINYEHVVAKLQLNVIYGSDAQSLDIKHLSLHAQGMGKITASINMGNFDHSLHTYLGDFENLLMASTIKGGFLYFDNEAIIDKGLNFAASVAEVDKNTLKQQIVTEVEMKLSQINNKIFTNMVTSALNSFMNDTSKTLRLRLAPQTPISISQIVTTLQQAPAELPEMLGVKFDAK